MAKSTSCSSVIALIDMDCFFVQVEKRGKPEVADKPCVVTQYNTYKGGGIIAACYKSRALGINKGMWGQDAQKICKDVQIFHTPQRRGKADSSKYREASFEVFDVLADFDSDLVIEKASIDEAYIDLTIYLNNHPELELPTKQEMTDCFVEGVSNYTENERDFDVFYDMITKEPQAYSEEIRLMKGAKLVSLLRKAILDKTQFECSAGISHSKVLAKLAAGIHKPNSQTILPDCGKKKVLAKTEIKKLRSLGGKFGTQVVERLDIQYVDQINNYTIEQLRVLFDEKTGDYLLNLANGIDDDKVVARKLTKSIGCAKNFTYSGNNCLNTKEQVEHWISQLVDELLERVERDRQMNNRRPTLLVASVDQSNVGMMSRSTQFEYFTQDRLVQIVMAKILIPLLFKKDNKTSNPIRMLSVAATKFTDQVDQKNTIDSHFKRMQSKQLETEVKSKEDQIIKKESSSEDCDNNHNKDSKISETTNPSSEHHQTENADQPLRSKTDFQNLNCKKMMDEYFREIEAGIERPKEVVKPQLTILNMFNKIAEQTGQDIKTRKEQDVAASDDQIEQPHESDNAANHQKISDQQTPSKHVQKPNPIIEMINKNNLRLQQPPLLISLDEDSRSSNQQASTSNQPANLSFVANQIEMIRQQGLLGEDELKKLELELLQDDQPRKVEKIGFFRRKTRELQEKKRSNLVT